MLVITSCTIHSPAGRTVPEILFCVLLNRKIEAPWKNKGEGKWEEKKVLGSVTLFVLVQKNFQDQASGGKKKSPLHSQPD